MTAQLPVIFWPFMACVVMLAVAGIYYVMATKNLIRALIGVELMIKAATLLIILAGRITGRLALAQSLVITLIVVEVVLMVAASGLVLCIFRNEESIGLDGVSRLKG